MIACAFLWLYLMEGSQGTRRKDLERAAELAVERAAERAAERAVEKALESGNTTSESETIRESYSSVRKYDKSLKLPETGYTPAQRREHDRIMQEREAAEKASAVLKRSIIDEGYDSSYESEKEDVDQTAQPQRQRVYYKNVSKIIATSSPRRYRGTRQVALSIKVQKSNARRDKERSDNQRILSSVSACLVPEVQIISFINF